MVPGESLQEWIRRYKDEVGKGKNNPLDQTANPDTCLEKATKKNMNPKMLASFEDGSKTMIEMTALANAINLPPDKIGMNGPVSSVEDLNKCTFS